MVLHEGGRWDVGASEKSVLLERISEHDDRLFEDLLAPDVARNLADLLNKFADKVDGSGDKDKTDESDKDETDDEDKTDDEDDEDDEDEDDDDSDEDESDKDDRSKKDDESKSKKKKKKKDDSSD